MLRQVLRLSLLAVFVLTIGCAGINIAKPPPSTNTTLPPEFFKTSKRIAIQNFNFAEGVETNAFSPTDSAFVRSVVESKIVEQSDFEVIMRKDEDILEEELAYKYGETPAKTDSDKQSETAANPEDTDKAKKSATSPTGKGIKQKLAVDAFVYGIIYEYNYDELKREYSITVAIKIVATNNGRIWQSKIVSVSGEKNKHILFDKLATNVAQTLKRPKEKTRITSTTKQKPQSTKK